MPDILKDIITAPIDAAADVSDKVGDFAGKNIPIFGNAINYGLKSGSDSLKTQAQIGQGNFGGAANSFLDSMSDAVHSPNTIPVVGKYIIPAVAAAFSGPFAPLGYAAATGIQNGFEADRKGASFGDAANYGLKSGALAGATYYAGNELLGPTLNGLGSSVSPASGGVTAGTMGTPISQSLGDTALSGAGSAFGSTTPGDLLATGVGTSIGEGMAGPIPGAATPPPPPWAPSRLDQASLPSSLSSLSNLDPNQQASNIATKGVYGGGQGPDENQYFLNLINRQLVDQAGNVGDQNSLPQIDRSYLAQLGLGGYGNSNDLLRGISQYQG